MTNRKTRNETNTGNTLGNPAMLRIVNLANNYEDLLVRNSSA